MSFAKTLTVLTMLASTSFGTSLEWSVKGKGISGTGEVFDLPGRRLGGFFCQPPLSSLLATALAATEKRSRVGSLLLSGPKRLGSDNSIMSAHSPIQAAERRLQDEIWCGSASCEEASEAGEGSSNPHALDDDTITRKRSSESYKASLVRPPNIHHLGSNFVDLTGDLSSGSVSNHDAKLSVDESTTWECGVCTLSFNPPLALICEVCARQRPKDLSSKYKFWSFKFCTLERLLCKLDKCCACSVEMHII